MGSYLMIVGRDLGGGQGDGFSPSGLPHGPVGEPGPLPLVDHGPPLDVREGKVGLAIPAVGGAYETEQWGVAGNGEQLPATFHPAIGTEIPAAAGDLTDERRTGIGMGGLREAQTSESPYEAGD